jgi:hypothetical protein
MFTIIFSLIVFLVLSRMAFDDYFNGEMKSAAFSGVLALLQIVIIGIELHKVL